jgi:flagellin-like hook-associated protein FlgL
VVNITGSDIPGSDVFNTLIALRTALSNNQPDQVRTQIGNLDTALQEVNTEIGKIGSRMNSLEAKEGALESVGIDKQVLLSDIVDTDIASAISDLNKYQIAFQASLKLLGGINDLNIVNYI